jgi:hypothetical protein
MKKQILILLASIVTMAQVVMAQTIILDVDTNLMTTTTGSVSGFKIPATGDYYVKLQSATVGSNQWKNYSVITYSQTFTAVFSHIADSLSPNTNHQFRFITYTDSTLTDSTISAVKTARTKPLPQPASVTLTNTVPGLPHSMIIVSYSSVGYQSKIYGLRSNNGQLITDTIIVSGTGVDTLRIANNPGQVIPAGFPVIQPMIAGISAVQGGTWNSFTAPSLVKPQLGLWTIDYRGVDSLRASIAIATAGNGGPITIRSSIKEENGTFIHNFANTNADSLTIGMGNLLPNIYYRFTAIAENFAGSDTSSVLVNTNQIAAPTVTISNTQKTKNSASFVVNVDPKGSSIGSTVSEVVIIEKVGSVSDTAIYQTFFQVAGTLSINRTGKVPNTTYTYSGWVKNDAGLTATIPQFSVTTDPPVQAIAPQWGSLWVESPSHIAIRSIGYSVNSGDEAQLLVLVRKDGTTTWDTIIVQGGLITSGTLDANITGLIGGTKYWFKIAMRSSDGHLAMNGTEKWEITIAPQAPDVFEIVINSLTEYVISFTIPGNGNGTLTSLKVELFEVSTGFLAESQTIPVGTGDFSHNGNFSGLYMGTDYEIRVTVSGPNNSNPMAISRFFKTLGTTSVDDILRDQNGDESVEMVGYNTLGQILGYGTKKEILRKFPNEVIIFHPRNENGTINKFGIRKGFNVGY